MKKLDEDIFNLKYKMFPLGTSEQKTKVSKDTITTVPTIKRKKLKSSASDNKVLQEIKER